jgi:hypothetical protein
VEWLARGVVEGRRLVAGDVDPATGRAHALLGEGTRRETWSRADGAWAQAKTKGRVPALHEARAAWVPARGALLVVGLTRTKHVTATFAPGSGQWTSWDLSGLDAIGGAARLMAVGHDAASGKTFSLWWDRGRTAQLALHAGEGAWTLEGEVGPAREPGLTEHVAGPDAAVAFDPAGRRLVAWGEVDRASGAAGLYVADLAPWLDGPAGVASPRRGL